MPWALKNGQVFRSRGEALGLEVGVGNEARLVQGDLGLLRKRYLSHFILQVSSLTRSQFHSFLVLVRLYMALERSCFKVTQGKEF